MGPKPVEKLVEDCISGRTPHLNALVERLPDVDPQLIYKLCMEIKSNRGNTVIHIGSRRGETVAIRLVLDMVSAAERVELLKQRNDWGRTALHHAVMHNQEETVRMELEMVEQEKRFELLKIQDQKGWTVLHRAAETGLLDVIRLLINSLPQNDRLKLLGIQNDDGYTAFNVALHSNHCDIAEFISTVSEDLQKNEGQEIISTQQQMITDAHEANIKKLREQTTKNSETIAKLASQVDSLRQKMAHLDTRTDNHSQTMAEMLKKLTEHDQIIAELKRQMEEQSKTCAELNKNSIDVKDATTMTDDCSFADSKQNKSIQRNKSLPEDVPCNRMLKTGKENKVLLESTNDPATRA